MKGYTLDETMNMRSLNRSPYRNMPEKCFKCAYASKKSSFGAICTMCPVKHKNNDEE
jgi:hypothetical protein